MQVSTSVAERHSEQEFYKQLYTLADAGAGVIHVRTNEVLRCVLALRKTILAGSNAYREWDVRNGARDFTVANINSDVVKGDESPDVLKAISEFTKSTPELPSEDALEFLVAVNPQYWMEGNPVFAHDIMTASFVYPTTTKRLILVTPDQGIPEPMSSLVATVRFEPPGHGELREYLEAVVEGVDSDNLVQIDEEGKDKICYVGAGMTKDAFEMYASIAIVAAASRDDIDTVDFQAIAEGVNEGKTEIVNKNDLLELYPTENMSDVGGMENLKNWVANRADCYSDEAREFGIEAPKGMVFVGPPGCLAGDTVVQYRRGARNSSRPLSLEDLYYKFNGLNKPGAGRGEATPWRDITMPTFLHSIDPDGTVRYNRVVSVIQSGVKQTIRVHFTDDTSITLTPTHPVAMPGGSYVPAGELVEGDKVLALGTMQPSTSGGRDLCSRPLRVIVNTKYHPGGSYKEVDGYVYHRVPKARLVIEAHMNSMSYDEFIHILNHNGQAASTLRYLPSGMEVHHVDENTLNDSPDNLMVYTKQEHAKEHGKVENFGVDYFSEREVSWVEHVGDSMTYDVQMEIPANNFAANGVFVHNTGKSLTAKAVAQVLGVPLVRLDFGKVFNSLVGKSEERMRTALHMVGTMAPCVLFCDEIDKGLGGIGGSGDSGTSSRVLGSFLTWLQDNEAPVFTMVTANNVDGLPPELMRRGRFDAIFSTGFPTSTERLEVLKIHLRKRGWDEEFTDKELNEVVVASKGYVPAEIESAVKDGLINAFSNDEELSVKHFTEALEAMVPISKAFADKISRMTLWAKENATPASCIYENVSADNVAAIGTGKRRTRTNKRIDEE